YSANPATVVEACNVLDDWDGRFAVDSVGAHIFREFWSGCCGGVERWQVPFDAADPVDTPRQWSDDPALIEATRSALAAAVDLLVDAGIPMNRPWGEIQFIDKNGERIGIHGGPGSTMFSVITSDLVAGEGYSDIRHGNSYMQAITWDESDCPVAYAMLTYSQSTDPASDHYADATALYSDGGWIRMPFCEAQRDEQELRRESIEE
ncbi:penicillin acylase family protein, partial [Mangrovimicrobium sediminis]